MLPAVERSTRHSTPQDRSARVRTKLYHTMQKKGATTVTPMKTSNDSQRKAAKSRTLTIVGDEPSLARNESTARAKRDMLHMTAIPGPTRPRWSHPRYLPYPEAPVDR